MPGPKVSPKVQPRLFWGRTRFSSRDPAAVSPESPSRIVGSDQTLSCANSIFVSRSLSLPPLLLALMLYGPFQMGPRPPDFDEDVIKQSPTFLKWQGLLPGMKLRYACREFTKDQGDDEERLMRRIMIARRNNIRDHEVLKLARKHTSPSHNTGTSAAATTTTATAPPPPPFRDGVKGGEEGNGVSDVVSAAPSSSAAAVAPTTAAGSQAHSVVSEAPTSAGAAVPSSAAAGQAPVPLAPPTLPIPLAAAPPPPTTTRRRRPASTFSDQQVELEMDVSAVEATRSYRAWQELGEGCEFVYNQKYIKGADGHDWLLRKNIWRRMRYRRDCKKMVERLKGSSSSSTTAYHDDASLSAPGGNDIGETTRDAQNKGDDESTDSDGDNPPIRPKGGATVPAVAERGAVAPPTTGPTSSTSKRKRVPERSDSRKQGRAALPDLVADSSLPHAEGDAVQRSESGDLDGTGMLVQSVQVTHLLQTQSHTSATERAAAAAAAAESILKVTGVADVATAAAAAAADHEAIEAAVAAAESFGKSAHILSPATLAAVTAGEAPLGVAAAAVADLHHHHHHHDQPLDAAALDAAAKLAAATALGQDEDDEAATAAATAVAASAGNLYTTV